MTSPTIFYRVHVHPSTGERDIVASIVEALENDFVRIEEKGTKKRFIVHRYKLGAIMLQTKKARNKK